MSQVAVKICQLSVLKIHGFQLLVTLVLKSHFPRKSKIA